MKNIGDYMVAVNDQVISEVVSEKNNKSRITADGKQWFLVSTDVLNDVYMGNKEKRIITDAEEVQY